MMNKDDGGQQDKFKAALDCLIRAARWYEAQQNAARKIDLDDAIARIRKAAKDLAEQDTWPTEDEVREMLMEMGIAAKAACERVNLISDPMPVPVLPELADTILAKYNPKQRLKIETAKAVLENG